MTIEFAEQALEPESRYQRHQLIKWWSQARLKNSRIMVVGAGAVGNEVLKNLALLGVGHLIAVDFDSVEESNLSRTVLFSSVDVGRPKAIAAAASVNRLNPDVECVGITGDLELDVGVGTVEECDLVLGCVDSVNARWAINRLCYRAGVTWINAGISSDAVEVSLFKPGVGPCYECSMTDAMWKRFNDRRSCMLLMKSLPPQHVATTAIVASLAASLQVNEAICELHDRPNRLLPGQKLFFNTNPYSFFVVDIPTSEDCPAHEKYSTTVTCEGSPASITPESLLVGVSGAKNIEFDFDLLLGFDCNQCGFEQTLMPVKRASSGQLRCPNCGEMRRPITTNEVTAESPFASQSLLKLGVPSKAVLRVRTTTGTEFVALTQ